MDCIAGVREETELKKQIGVGKAEASMFMGQSLGEEGGKQRMSFRDLEKRPLEK